MTSKWYVVQTKGWNQERGVADWIGEQARQRGPAAFFERIEVPTRRDFIIRRGRKVPVEETFFPGYVLLKIELTDDVYQLVMGTPNSAGFVGADNKPMPFSDAEVERLLHRVL